MAAEAGHAPNRAYHDLSGNIHLNGATLYGSSASAIVSDDGTPVPPVPPASQTTDPGAGNDSSQGYVFGSVWINTTLSREWTCQSNALGAAVWILSGVVPGVGIEPSTMLTQAGAGTGSFPEEGNVSRQSSLAGIGNGADTTDDVLFTYSMPASSFDQANRQIQIVAFGSFAANGNNKRCKLWFGATVVADTGVTAQNAGGWNLVAYVTKVGAAGSNTQKSQGQSIVGTTHGGCTAPASPTENESGVIVVKVTGASPTTGAANDVLGNMFEVNFMN